MQDANPAIVVLYAPPWDAPARLSKHHLALHWSRTRPVLYVETPVHPLSLLKRPEEARRLFKRSLSGPVAISPTLWVHACACPLPYRASPRLMGYRWVNTLNQIVVRPQLRRLLRRLGVRRPIVVVGGAHALPLLEALDASLVIYHCSDDFTRQESFPASYADLERDLTRRCDLVITTAEALRRAKAHLHPRVCAVPNGADVAHFATTQDASTPPAEELASLRRPVIGYIGTVFEWIDQEMVAAAARARPHWTFVFVGPVATEVRRLRALSNVRLLGSRPYADLPRFLKAFDVATVPFVVHPVTLRASPIKFYEYLAAGVPVVATRLPEFEPLGGWATLVTSPGEFVTGIERAMQDESAELRHRRMEQARRHSWEARFAAIDQLIGVAWWRKATRSALVTGPPSWGARV
jgi:glycosyltransferase involved in cell wall biosynthesis